ncbi:MAG: hypothetical protein ACKVS6_09870 [Planctomycetota bacterium]
MSARVPYSKHGWIPLAWIIARRILTSWFGVLWAGVLAAFVYLAFRVGALDTERANGEACAFLCISGLLVAACVAAFAPIVYFGKRDGRPVDGFYGSRPLGAMDRALGPLGGALLAAFVIFIVFIISAQLSFGIQSLNLRKSREILQFAAAELRAANDTLSLDMIVREPSELRVAPRLGFASGYGEPNPVTLQISILATLPPANAPVVKELTIQGREVSYLQIPVCHRAQLIIKKIGDGPLVRWSAGTLAVVSSPDSFGVLLDRYLLTVLLLLLQISAMAALLSAILEVPVAMLASATHLFVLFLAPSQTMRNFMGALQLLDAEGFARGAVRSLTIESVARTVAISMVCIFIAIFFRRTRQTRPK